MNAIIKRNNLFNNTHFNRNDAEYLNMNENYKKFISVYNNLNNENENNSLENTHSISPIKHIYRNKDNYRNITFSQDLISINNKKNLSSSLNNSCSDISNIISNDYKNKNNICSKESFEVDNYNNKKEKGKNNYRTIKIKKIYKKTKNDKNNDERLNKIKSNFLYKKNITFSSLNINNIDNNKYNNICDYNDNYINNVNNENNNVNSNINNNDYERH